MLRTIFAGIVPDELSFDEFVTADDGLPTESSKFELSTIIEQETGEEEVEEEEDVNEDVQQAPTGREAVRMCEQLQLYLCAQDANESELTALDSVLAFVEEKKGEQKKQAVMTQFFAPVP